MNIDTFAQDLLNGNGVNNSIFAQNESERDGNTDDLLLRIDQPGVNIQGGNTFTAISPFTAVSEFLNDLAKGKLNPVGLFWVIVIGAVAWFLLKK